MKVEQFDNRIVDVPDGDGCIDLSVLKLNERNPRTITREAFNRLCESIRRDPKFMELRPIIVDKDNVIIGGNQRYRACIQLGMTKIPVSWVKIATNLTEQERKRFILVDNSPEGMTGEWDFDLLAAEWELDELKDLGFDKLLAELNLPVITEEAPDSREENEDEIDESMFEQPDPGASSWPLQAPFPWFGGKRRVAGIVWKRFGADIKNYVEPFFGSGAVLLGRPGNPPFGIETVNDKDGYVCNFWRAIKYKPDEVAKYADWPVNENDLHARHAWLVQQRADLVARLEGDPDYCDPKIAGWWVWGISIYIGSGFCSGKGAWHVQDGKLVKLDHTKAEASNRIDRRRVHLGNSGMGVCKSQPIDRLAWLEQWFSALSARLRDVRVCCGDWSRVCGKSPTFNHGLTAVFLDPPYSEAANRFEELYTVEDLHVAHDVREWAIEQGKNELMRIALCGHEGEHEMPKSWTKVKWKKNVGYAVQAKRTQRGTENVKREVIWFSPACLKPE